jgi:hypothetical protein
METGVQEKPTDLSQVTDKFYWIKLYRKHIFMSWNQARKTFVVLDSDQLHLSSDRGHD